MRISNTISQQTNLAENARLLKNINACDQLINYYFDPCEMLRNFETEYEIGRVLGVGNFAEVREVIHKKTGVRRAAKAIDRTSLTSKQRESVQSEIDILSKLHHPNIVNLHEVFETPDVLYMIMEFITDATCVCLVLPGLMEIIQYGAYNFILTAARKTGGELFDKIVANTYLNEEEASRIMRQIGYGVSFLHKRKVIHRDLKPENILFENTNEDSTVCICDFGLAKRLTGVDENMNTPCGTLGYVAPEIANEESYTKGVDMWALGVIMYTMLCGYPPFYAEDDETLIELIQDGTYTFEDEPWSDVSLEAKDLICNLLQKDPQKRYTAEQFLAHKWISGQSLPLESPRIFSPTKEKPLLKSDEIKNVLNRSIQVQREAKNLVQLKAASEGTLWKKRHQKKVMEERERIYIDVSCATKYCLPVKEILQFGSPQVDYLSKRKRVADTSVRQLLDHSCEFSPEDVMYD